MKTIKELQEEGIDVCWLTYYQIRGRFLKDVKNTGIERKTNELDKIISQKGKK